jgi:hypothetical protein
MVGWKQRQQFLCRYTAMVLPVQRLPHTLLAVGSAPGVESYRH